MSTTCAGPPETPSNPFSTRWVRPGAITYRFPASESVHRILERLQSSQWFGQIVGPHGSGKSALLKTLHSVWHEVGRSPVAIQLRDGQRRLPLSRHDVSSWTTDTQVIVDGYEQLKWASRWRLSRWCRLRGCGLLVTVHKPTCLPVVYRADTSLDVTRELVEQLVADQPYLVGPDEVEACFRNSRGNVRETFFALYDVARTKQRTAAL